MKVLRVKKTSIYDVFIGNGWEHHSRILYKESKIVYLNGIHLRQDQILTLLVKLELGV